MTLYPQMPSKLRLVSHAAEWLCAVEFAVLYDRHKALLQTRPYHKEMLPPMSKQLRLFTGESNFYICCLPHIGWKKQPM